MSRNYDRVLATDERITEFILKLKARKRNLARIRGLCLGERNYLKSARYVKRGDDADDANARTTLSMTRRHAIITRYRKAIVTEFGPSHPALKYMRLSDEEQNARNDADRKRVVKQHHDRRAIDVDAHVSKAKQILQEACEGMHAALRVAAALIAVTGRRPIEILLTGTFEAQSDKYALLFSGQAKVKSDDNPHAKPYVIPTLIEAALVLKAFEMLRKRYNVQGMTPQQVGNRAWKEVGKYAKADYADKEGEPITPSELRAVYATIAYEMHAPERYSWNAFTAKILGHSTFDLVTSLSYDQFFPHRSKRAYTTAIRHALRETIADMQARYEREPDERQREFLSEKIARLTRRLKAE